jgi:hypothetical protein
MACRSNRGSSCCYYASASLGKIRNGLSGLSGLGGYRRVFCLFVLRRIFWEEMKMNIVMWDKPKQVMSKEEWKGISADSAPPGVYSPNMNEEDMATWKGKVVGATLGHPQVELRKTFGAYFPPEPGEFCGHSCTSNMVIILSKKGGFQYKQIKREYSKDYNVLIAMNGNAVMTFAELDEMKKAIDEGVNKLIEIETLVRLDKKEKKK